MDNKTVFIIRGGGQRIQQITADDGACVVPYEVSNDFNRPYRDELDGVCRFAGDMWHVDLVTLHFWACEMAGKHVFLRECEPSTGSSYVIPDPDPTALPLCSAYVDVLKSHVIDFIDFSDVDYALIAERRVDATFHEFVDSVIFDCCYAGLRLRDIVSTLNDAFKQLS